MNKASLHKIKTRCYCVESLAKNKKITLDSEHFKHVCIVLRAKVNDIISVFNQNDGEFVASIVEIKKNNFTLEILEQIKIFTPKQYKFHLAYAPLKKEANDFMIEKATELGVKEITQIITERTVNKPLDIEKIKYKTILASQQCGRLDIPQINDKTNLINFMQSNLENNSIFWLNEKQDSSPLSSIDTHKIKQNIIILIGPEGGFSDNEINYLKNTKQIFNVYLNTNILRAETAGISAIVAINTIVNQL